MIGASNNPGAAVMAILVENLMTSPSGSREARNAGWRDRGGVSFL